MESEIGYAQKPVISTGYLARQERVSCGVIENAAQQLGIELVRTPAGHRHLTVAQADAIAKHIRTRAAARR